MVPIFPLIALAQTGTIQTFLSGINELLNKFVIPFLITLAVLFFIYNTVQYFIIQSADEEGRKKAKQFMLYSLVAFLVIVTLWAIVTFVINGLGFGVGTVPVCPDYLPASACPTGNNSSPTP